MYCSLFNQKMEWEEIKYRLTHVLDFTAIIAYNDMMAMNIYSLLQGNDGSQGISKENIVGFDNALESFPMFLKLPSVAERDLKASTAAPSLLLEMIASKEPIVRKIVLDVKLYQT